MFVLTLVTPEKKLVSAQEIEEIFVPAYRGELNILPGHAPLMTTLRTGVLKYRLKGESTLHYVAISRGYCQVNPFGVNVLTETAERPEDLDAERIEQALKDAERKLTSNEVDAAILEDCQNRILRAWARKEVVSHASGNTTH